MEAELFRKYVSSSMIVCYRSVVRHPFLLCMIVILFSMYRLFPLLFSILVSASPVIVSTAVLLGTLLSFGQPNIPEIEEESKSDRDEIWKSESEVVNRTEIAGRDGSFAFEETNESRIKVADKSFEGKTSVNDDDYGVEADRPVNLVGFGEEQLIEEAKSEIDEEKIALGSCYSPLQQTEDEHIVLEGDDKLWEGSADPLNSNSGLLWKRVEHDDDHDDDGDDEGSDSGDSGSDGAESSSPDASMADIIPMLDELHPLLSEEQETHEPHHMSRDGTDAVSEHSLESSDTSSESNGDDGSGGSIKNREDLEVADDDDDHDGDDDHDDDHDHDDDGEGNESKHIDKEDETRSAITWTEYDQKNLMDLGTSEMERNRRLENLIARRRARKTTRMQAEKNLIDLDSSDFPWNIPPISTARNNPFDYDSNDNIPGSAPSVLLQRRNPFDLPYDSSEEKPDLVGDTFQKEFASIQPKEPFFRRHESFNVGPSIFGASRSERQETKLRPYFVPERSFSEFQRQFSGLSDSKISSVLDTESVSSVSDLENKDHIEVDQILEAEQGTEIGEHVPDHVSQGRPYFVPEHVASDETLIFTFQRQDSKASSVPDTESVSSAGYLENKDQIEDSHSLEAELVSEKDHEHGFEISEHVSDHVSHESESSEDDHDLEFIQQVAENAASSMDLMSDGIHLNLGDVSSLSSSDEVSDQIYNDKEDDDEVATSVSETNYHFHDNSIETPEIETPEIEITSLLVEETHPKEPVYDTSPRGVTRNLSSSSISNDLHKYESFEHTEDQHQSSSSVTELNWNLTDSSLETRDGQSQLSTVLETEDVVLDMNASQSEERSFSDRCLDKPSAEDPEELQVQITSNELDNLQIVEPENNVSLNINSASDTLNIESNNAADNIDDADEIDENLLLELDAVGDFSVSDLGSTLNEMKEGPHDVDHDLETKRNADDGFYAEDFGSVLNEIKRDPHASDHDLEIKNFGDENSESNDLGLTLNEMKRDPHALDHDFENKIFGDEDSESKIIGSLTLNETEQDSHVSKHDLESNGFVDAKVMDSEAESSKIMLSKDDNQETEPSTYLVNHETKNASSTSNMDKE